MKAKLTKIIFLFIFIPNFIYAQQTIKIMEFYSTWRETKYLYGGTSKNGIDCSALIQQLYKEKFNIKLPRTTNTQVKLGKQIEEKIEVWKPGDLLFFKVNHQTNHVGVYIGDKKFIHAGRTTGVTISKYNNYWSKKFWQIRRIM